ncbi:MAG: hypothetical protein E6I13_05230 [Chloroflexi bacterium]|nr:MAG: hypothetical protein E6I13_05230 [Chloroflexota bacterium]
MPTAVDASAAVTREQASTDAMCVAVVGLAVGDSLELDEELLAPHAAPSIQTVTAARAAHRRPPDVSE